MLDSEGEKKIHLEILGNSPDECETLEKQDKVVLIFFFPRRSFFNDNYSFTSRLTVWKIQRETLFRLDVSLSGGR